MDASPLLCLSNADSNSLTIDTGRRKGRLEKVGDAVAAILGEGGGFGAEGLRKQPAIPASMPSSLPSSSLSFLFPVLDGGGTKYATEAEEEEGRLLGIRSGTIFTGS